MRRPECLGAYVYSICNNVVLEYLRGKSKPEHWDERVEERRDPGVCLERELVNEEQSRQMRQPDGPNDTERSFSDLRHFSG